MVENPKYPPLRVDDSYVERLEAWCDEFNAELPKLDSFILPAAGEERRAGQVLAERHERRGRPGVLDERREPVVEAEAVPERTNRTALLYLNRLSDLLFILSRIANPDGDVLWKPGGER